LTVTLQIYNQKKQFRTICFPGAEHLVSKKDEADYLTLTYNKLDNNLKLQGKQSGILDRVKRVLMARRLEG